MQIYTADMEAGTIELQKKLIHNINQSIMKANIFFKILFTILIITITYSCSNNDKDNNIPAPAPNKSIKFEITGNYSGHIFIVYNDNVSGNTSLTATSLPWSQTIDYPNSVVGIGISGNAVTTNPGIAGQSVSLKIYNGTTVVSQSNKNSVTNGLFILDT